MILIKTDRLILKPSNIELGRLEIDGNDAFGQHLDAIIPDNWPPESIADALPFFLKLMEASPDAIGWYGWYALTTESDGLPTLVASCGFKGPPTDAGVVEVGYSVLPQFQGKGYATEMVHALVHWAKMHTNVVTIAAETEWENPASARVLAKCGFSEVGEGCEPGGKRYIHGVELKP